MQFVSNYTEIKTKQYFDYYFYIHNYINYILSLNILLLTKKKKIA